MIERVTRLASGLAVKALGLGAQLVTLVLIAQALGAQGFGSYSVVLSVISIAAQLVDFGLGRYQFRLAHRGRPVAMLAMWSLAFRGAATLVVLPPVLFYAFWADMPLVALALGFAANILFQLANLNRHLLLLSDRIAAAILVESGPPLLFCTALALCFARGTPLSVTDALLLYFIGTLAGFVLSVAGAGTARSWMRGATMLLRGPVSRTLAGIALLARRSSLIGIDIFVAAATFNAPTLIVTAIGGEAATPQVALYQRLLGLEVALLSVTVTARLKAYHDSGSGRTLDVRPALASGAFVFALNAAGLLVVEPLTRLMPGLQGITLVELALSLRPHLLLLAAVTASVAAYLHCSMAALGGNWLWERCVSGCAGLAATITAAALLTARGAEPFTAVLQASLLGQTLAIAVLVTGVVRQGANILLPRVPLPVRSPAAGARP
jgi:hypothetical protein